MCRETSFTNCVTASPSTASRFRRRRGSVLLALTLHHQVPISTVTPSRLSTSASGVYASSLTKHLDRILELMADVTLRPSFQQEELDKIKKETISGLQANKDDPDAIASNVRNVLRYGKTHPYGELITEETVALILADNIILLYFLW